MPSNCRPLPSRIIPGSLLLSAAFPAQAHVAEGAAILHGLVHLAPTLAAGATGIALLVIAVRARRRDPDA